MFHNNSPCFYFICFKLIKHTKIIEAVQGTMHQSIPNFSWHGHVGGCCGRWWEGAYATGVDHFHLQRSLDERQEAWCTLGRSPVNRYIKETVTDNNLKKNCILKNLNFPFKESVYGLPT